MSRRITSLDSPDFAALFTGYLHTAYRLETLQSYDVGYEDESFRAFLAGTQPPEQARNEWTAMIRASVAAGKTFQRVHIISELTDYLRYELEWWYGPNVEAGEDIRILPADSGRWPPLPHHDYWLFDSRDLWLMMYGAGGEFVCAELVEDPEVIVRHAYWRDLALHYAIPYRDYMNRPLLRHAS